MHRSTNPLWLSLILQILMPGLGHAYWKEYAFGLFVFLVMLLTSAIFFVSLLIPLSSLAKFALLGLPLVFYLFAFFDLAKSVRMRRSSIKHTTRIAIICLVVGLVYQIASPSAPGNFIIRNHPSVSRVGGSQLAPFLRSEEWFWVNRAAYAADVFFLNRPLLHKLPEFTDLIAYHETDGVTRYGMVMGGLSESIEVSAGILYLNGSPINDLLPKGLLLAQDWPLTTSDETSILVATLSAGAIAAFQSVSLADIDGQVHRLM